MRGRKVGGKEKGGMEGEKDGMEGGGERWGGGRGRKVGGAGDVCAVHYCTTCW